MVLLGRNADSYIKSIADYHKMKEPKLRVESGGLAYSGSADKRNIIFDRKEYDLVFIEQLLDKESLFKRAVDKYVEQIWKNPPRYVGKNKNACNYIRKRLEQIAKVSNYPTAQFLEDVAKDLVIFSNAYVLKVRSNKASGGRERIDFTGKKLIPVAGYFMLPAPYVKIASYKNGKPLKYSLEIPGKEEKQFDAEDIVHIFFNRKTGAVEGTPMVVPVINDIAALRRMEENAEILVFQHAIPLYHYIVGTEKRPTLDANRITEVRTQVENMLAHGAIFTDERVKIEVADIKTMDVLPYIQYYKNRVLSGLGISAVAMGEASTSNKNTALIVQDEMLNTTKRFQNTIKEFFNFFIIPELLDEGGWNIDHSDINDQNGVKMQIIEIDTAEQRAREQHGISLFQADVLTRSEVRMDYLSRDILQESQEEDLFLNKVSIPKLAAAKGFSDASKIQNQISSQTNPTNQYGTKPRPAKKEKSE